ncbi:MAG: recombination protein O N-terminal domain-containing protein, partial [Aquificaceae bacterium]|nr:recombination protein O N-terminal domain-containing protein [Aquificaceae bacterium]
MPAKGKFLILRRFRAGDQDLMLKAYGTCGMVKVYVQDGLLPQEGMLALVEPFNLLEAVYRQSGELVFFKDILSLE